MNTVQRWFAQKLLGVPKDAFTDSTGKRVNPAAFVTTWHSIGDGAAGVAQYPFDVNKLEQIYEVSPYVYAAVQAIARDVAATPMIVERRTATDWQKMDRPPEWSRVFETPNPDDSLEQFLKDHVFGLYGAGNGYMAFDESDGPELYNVPASAVKARVDKKLGTIGSYQISAGGQEKTIDAEMMIQTRLPRVIHSIYGTPPAALLKKTLSAQYYLIDLIDCFFKNGAFLNMLLKYKGPDLKPEERAQIITQFEKRQTGMGNKFRVALLEGDMEAVNATMTLKDILPLDADELFQMIVLAAYGVPPIIIGNQQQKYDNAKEQVARYQNGTVEPVRRTLESALNQQLIRKKFETSGNIRIAFDRSDVPGLVDTVAKTETATKLYTSGLVNRDEGRKLAGLDPTGDGTGTEYYKPPTQPNVADPNAPRSAATSKTRLEKPDRERLWWAHNARLTGHEKTVKQAMRNYFLDQGDRVLAAFDKITAGRTVVSALRASLLTRGDVPGGDRADEIFNTTAENNALKKEIRPIIVRIMTESAEAAQEQWSLNVAFDVTNPMIDSIVKAAENRIVKINDTTYDAIKRLLQNAIDDGESLDSVARRIRDLFEGFSKARATVVAQTETNGIVNGATDATFRMAGIEKKEWLATLDDVTRDAHAEADGQIVPTSSAFDVGGEALAFPGDQGGSPGNTINCRCAMAPVIE